MKSVKVFETENYNSTIPMEWIEIMIDLFQWAIDNWGSEPMDVYDEWVKIRNKRFDYYKGRDPYKFKINKRGEENASLTDVRRLVIQNIGLDSDDAECLSDLYNLYITRTRFEWEGTWTGGRAVSFLITSSGYAILSARTGTKEPSYFLGTCEVIREYFPELCADVEKEEE